MTLGLICILLGLWFFKKVFYGYWNDNLLLFILIGPGKPILSGSFLLFYFKSYYKALNRNYIIKHISIPIAYYFLIIFFRFFLSDSDPGFHLKLSIIFSLIIVTVFWYYFIITRKELKQRLKKYVIPKAYKKLEILFYSVYFFLLQVPLWDILKKLLQTRFLSKNLHSSLEFLYGNIFQVFGENFAYGYLHTLGYILFIYALSEVSLFKRIFLPKNTSIHKNTIYEGDKIDQLIRTYFVTHKGHKNPKLTIESCAKDLNITKKELIDYLKLTNKGTFTEFVNKQRVQEFKQLLKKAENQRFNIVGLSKECGFKSKSTFFRVFKNIEGITPNEYKKSQHE